MAIINDAHLSYLTDEQKEQLINARLGNASAQLLETMLNLEAVKGATGTDKEKEGDIGTLEGAIATLRTTIDIHREELDALSKIAKS